MTHMPADLDAGQVEPSEPTVGGRQRPGAGYLALLRLPGAARFCVAGMVGRAPMAMFGLGTLLLVASRTGRYGLAGLVAGVGSIGYAVAAPQVARLADRFGQQRVLRPLVAIFAASCIVFVASTELGAPVWVLMITGCAAGSSVPSLGSMVRARWSALLRGGPLLQSAFALESVVDEMIFVVGPALVTLLAAALPPAGVLLCVVLSVTGTLLFAAQRQTEPPTQPTDGQARSAMKGIRRSAPGLLTMAPLYLCLGAMFASIDISTVDFAQRHGHKPLAGFILGTYALGSAIGGLWYGSRTWRASVERRFALTLILTVAGVSHVLGPARAADARRRHAGRGSDDLPYAHRGLQPHRAASPRIAPHGGHDVAVVSDFDRTCSRFGHIRTDNRCGRATLGLWIRRNLRIVRCHHMPRGAEEVACGT